MDASESLAGERARPPSAPDTSTGDATPWWVPLLDRAGELGSLVWIERALFTYLGRWSNRPGRPSLVVHLGGCSRRHGHHADVLHERLPELSTLDVAALVRPPDSPLAALLDQLVASDTLDPETSFAVHQLVVLPAVTTRLRGVLDTCSPVSDASLRYWLPRLIDDDVAERQAGERLVADGVADGEAVRAAASLLGGEPG